MGACEFERMRMKVYLVQCGSGTWVDLWGNELATTVVRTAFSVEETSERVTRVVAGGDGRTQDVPVWVDRDGGRWFLPPTVDAWGSRVFFCLDNPSRATRLDSFSISDRLTLRGLPCTDGDIRRGVDRNGGALCLDRHP